MNISEEELIEYAKPKATNPTMTGMCVELYFFRG